MRLSCVVALRENPLSGGLMLFTNHFSLDANWFNVIPAGY